MSSIVTLVIENTIQKLSRPGFVKWALVIMFAVFILSQLLVLYFFVPGNINPDITATECLKALQDFQNRGFVENWANLITAAAVIFIKFKVLVVILSILVFLAAWGIVYIIPNEWIEIAGILAVLLLLAAPVIIAGLVIVEILPFYIANDFIGMINR